MKSLHPLLVAFAILFSGGLWAQEIIIPKPQHLKVLNGTYTLGKTITIKKDKKVPEVDYLTQQLQSITDNHTVKTVNRKADINTTFIDSTTNTNEGYYKLSVDKKGFHIAAPTNKGLFYGMQTLLQIIEHHKDGNIPFMEIEDYPKYAYRGMHLDVGRHFFSVDEIKNYLDYLATFKYDKFHWHLTEDQGWRIEIKKYPKLQEVAAWRSGSMVGHYGDHLYNDKKYGGYYTQEEAKEVVAYAKKLHIDVIPEIEMPGHAQAAITAYPELGCTDKPVEVRKKWGISEDIYCPKEETFEFLEDVIDEIVKIFPYKYIHVGGDEAPKKQWKNSEIAQQVIKREGLKDEEELQSYFISRMEKYINSKGKQIIGWDEILQGGLAPNATVMSWRGIEGGIKAAKTHHKAIMTPTSTNYFDYYQGNPKVEPLAIGGYLPLEKVYDYQPVPDDLAPDKAKYIWGTQANLWTEYIQNFKKVEYMIFPRMMALSEVAWGTSDPDNYENFEERVVKHFSILDHKGINYSRAIFEVHGKVENTNGEITYQLSSGRKSNNIRYTTDGTTPVITNSKKYSQPISVDHSMTIKAAAFKDGKKMSSTLPQDFILTKSTGKHIELENKPTDPHAEGGSNALVDGVRGNIEYQDKHWLGFQGKDVVATIDLDQKTEFSNVSFTAINNTGSWIHLPAGVKIAVSQDGKQFKTVKKVSQQEIADAEGEIDLHFPAQKAPYLKVSIQNVGTIPEDSPGAGSKAWLYIDEIAVN